MLYKVICCIFLGYFLVFNGSLRGQGLPPGWDYTITSAFHPIAVPLSADPSLFEEPIAAGDYIGVFFVRNDSLICAGAGEWYGDENIAVVAYGDDNMTTVKDGFYVGETIHWKIWSWEYENGFNAAATYDPAMPVSDGKFYPGGLSALLSLDHGFAFGAEASANPDTVCVGGASQLTATPSGGSGIYSYLWTSDPPGYSSTQQSPSVSPVISTTYFLAIGDGYNIVYDTTQVTVVPLPVVLAGADQSICEDSQADLEGTATGYSSVIWTTSGDGDFGDEALLTTTYTPGTTDKETGLVKLTLKAFPVAPCEDDVSDFLFLSITLLPLVDAGEDGSVCAGDDYTLTGAAVNATGIEWTTSGDGTFDDAGYLAATYSPGPVDTGTGQVILTLSAQPFPPCQAAVSDPMTLTIHPLPSVDAGPDQTIPYGTYTQLNGTVQGGSGSYAYSWVPAEYLLNPSSEDPTTETLTQSVGFTLTGTDAGTLCHGSDGMMVFISGGPLSVEASAEPGVICSGNPTQLYALPTGGSGEYTYEWTSDPPGFYSELQNPEAYPEESTTYTVEIFDGFNTNSGAVTVTVYPPPLADAGEDQTIPYGTHTALNGSVSGGSGAFSYFWSPAQYLVNPSVQNPITTNLIHPVDFRLMVTDLVTQCQDIDSVSVFITGGPLEITVSAVPGQICRGDSSQLLAEVSGGTGFYWYSWTSDPPGFESELPNPVVYPLASTDYYVTVTDNYSTVNGLTSVEVFPLPEVMITAFPDDTVCAGEWITLDATVPGGIEYLWEPGDLTGAVISVDSTGIGFGTVAYTVYVTTLNGCEGEDSIEITFFNCVGVAEPLTTPVRMRLFPNPATEQLTVSIDPLFYQQAPLNPSSMPYLEILNINGQPILTIQLTNNQSLITFSVSHFTPGIYFVILRNSTEVINGISLVVE